MLNLFQEVAGLLARSANEVERFLYALWVEIVLIAPLWNAYSENLPVIDAIRRFME